jgi:putative component of membrane protein insertase Oxa1/YidC/SpoIIIJ protein YidD
MRNDFDSLIGLPSRAVAAWITLYQRTLSPDHGPLQHLYTYGYCRHEPTCSEFTKRAVLRDGVIVGLAKGMRRVLTCHPWAPLSDEKLRAMTKR